MKILIFLGVAAGIMFVFPWWRSLIIILAIVALIALLFFGRRPLKVSPVLLLAVIPIIGYAIYATLAPPWEADFLADWGVKARVFFEAHRIDWHYLQTERTVHPDYPPLVPLLFDFVAVVSGGWNDRLFGSVNVAFAIGLLLTIHRFAIEESESALIAAIVVVAAVPLAATPWIAIADGPFIAYATAALLLMRRHITAGSVMLGLAAETKNEGLTLILAVAIAMLLVGKKRDVLRLWPAVAIAAPWLLCRAILGLQTDVTAGDFFARVFEHLRDPGAVMAAFANAPVGRPLFLAALLLGAVIAWRPLVERYGFVLVAVALQFAFYVVVYLGTPHDITWHIRWSWERLIAHLTPSLAVIVLLANLQLVIPSAAERPSSALPA